MSRIVAIFFTFCDFLHVVLQNTGKNICDEKGNLYMIDVDCKRMHEQKQNMMSYLREY